VNYYHDPSGRIEQDRRHRLRLALDSNRCPGLLPLLEAAEGAVVCGLYRVDHILAVGSQFIVWSAVELSSGRPAVLKQGRFDYRYPVQYGRADANRCREAIRREYEVLLEDRSGTLPHARGLLVGDSPVPAAAASPVLHRDEVFVIEEYIQGLTLTELALRAWADLPMREREIAAARLAFAFVTFWENLNAAGWFYGDLSPDNLLLERSGKLRMVDAGNAVPAADRVILTGFTPAFTAPRMYAAATQGRPVPGTLSSVLPSLGKLLHFALTGREQFNGHLPNLDDPSLEEYSPHCRLVLELLAGVDGRPEKGADARNALGSWCGAIGYINEL
jgi:serine/threonine protein kinase